MKLLIGIPAYNEEKMIKTVIDFLPSKLAGISKIDILVIDDGSIDQTGIVAKKSGAIVLTHLLNRGLGGALKTILSYAKDYNYDILLTFDADGQHDASDIKKVVSKLLNSNNNVIVGSRWSGHSYKPYFRYLVNLLANLFTYIMFGIWTTDSQSGFRVFDRKAINKINLITDGMEVSSEIFKEIYRNNLNYAEVPIKVIYSDYSRKKGQQITNAPNIVFQILFRLIK